MWKLARPRISEVQTQLSAALGSKAAGHPSSPTDAERQALWSLYRAFETGAGRPNDAYKGIGLRTEFLQLVHDAYKQVRDGGRLAELRNTIKLGAVECPYCGFGQIQDLDHHLQKAVYKLLSIFPLNLVPACATCNRGKPRAPDADGNKHLLNVYLEDFTDQTFFAARVAIDPSSGGLKVQFHIARVHGMSDEIFNRLTFHIEIFNLQERLLHQTNIYLATLEVALADQFASGGASSVKDFLERCADANGKRFGRNDWRTALLTGLKDCTAFCAGGFAKALGRPSP